MTKAGASESKDTDVFDDTEAGVSGVGVEVQWASLLLSLSLSTIDGLV